MWSGQRLSLVAALYTAASCFVSVTDGVAYIRGAEHIDLPFDSSNTCEGNIDWQKLTPLDETKLPAGIKDHNFLFVIGAHHSGTTLLDLILSENDGSSRLAKTHQPQDEGQHVQSVYPTARKKGGMFGYGFKPESYMTEKHHTITESNRDKIYGEWAKFWDDVSKPLLLEKSPPHIIMTRYMQAMFGPSRSYFPIILRHPLGAANFFLRKATKDTPIEIRAPGRYTEEERTKKLKKREKLQRNRVKSIGKVEDDCGFSFVRHWLFLHRGLARDIKCLKNAGVLQFEAFLGVDNARTVGYAKAILEFAGLESGELDLDIGGTPRTPESLRAAEFGDDIFDDAGADAVDAGPTIDPYEEEDAEKPLTAGGRRLLEFHGNRKKLTVNVGQEFSWVKLWKETVDLDSDACRHMIDSLEGEVNYFGYSLKNLTWYESPKAFQGRMFKPLI